ncbi:MAG: TetR/AcrR family transcriptional regulator [Sneathiella sp.]
MPKKIDITERQETIADAAISVIEEMGLEGARLRDVAKAANVTTGAVTHYFDGKEAVLEAALQQIVRRTLARMTRSEHRKGTTDLHRFIEQACRYLPLDEEGRREWRVWMAFWGRAIVDDRLRAIHQGYYAAFVEGVSKTLIPLCSGTVPPRQEAVSACADALIAAIDGIGTRATLDPDHWPEARQREALDHLLHPLLTTFIGRAQAL